MNLGQAVVSGFKRFNDFEGRSSRSEYWWWALFQITVSIIADLNDGVLFNMDEIGLIGLIINLILLIPTLAVSVRRLHDIDRSGWWLLLLLTVIGSIVLLVWHLQKGSKGPNIYGSDPLVE